LKKIIIALGEEKKVEWVNGGSKVGTYEEKIHRMSPTNHIWRVMAGMTRSLTFQTGALMSGNGIILQ
jgi:hypothetical protein